MQKITSSLKVCGTCTYWSGERKVGTMAKSVDIISDKGKCMIPQGPCRNFIRTCRATCKGFLKWSVLK